MRAAIVDTGPLVAFLDRAEHHHRSAAQRIEELDTPLLLCEPVLAETMHLLARFSRAQDALLGLLENGAAIYERHAVLTLDSDFSVYRKHGRSEDCGLNC
jgi:predicted nucleic acid-binding protein